MNYIKLLTYILLLSISITGLNAKTTRKVKKAKKNKQVNALLFEVSGNGLQAPSYIYGTIHLIPKKDFFVEDKIKEAIKQTKKAVFEMKLDDPTIQAKTMAGIKVDENNTLDKLLSAEDYETIKNFFKDSLNADLTKYNGIKPIFIYQSTITRKIMGKEVESYDMYFVNLAKENNLPIEGLETIENQLATIDQIPYKKQAEMLLDAVKNYQRKLDEFHQMVTYYKEKNINGLLNLILEDKSGFKEFEKQLLIDRNQNWIPQMIDYMKTEPTFFGVGAGHLAGKNGIIQLLKNQGYTVKPL